MDAVAYNVLVRLADGSHVQAGGFESATEARAAAEQVAGGLQRAGEWPAFGDRLVQPAAVVSVDVVPEQAPAWEGSAARRVSD